MTTFRLRIALVTGVIIGAACGPIQPLTKTVDPEVRSLAVVLGGGVANADPNCTPVTVAGAAQPQAWWNALRADESPKRVNEGVVGFHLTVGAPGSCHGFRQDLYRMVFAYDLQPSAPLKGLVRSATLTFQAAVLPQLRPGFGCELLSGGGGGLLRLGASTTLPPSNFTQLPTGTAFPAGGVVFSVPQPAQPGQIAPGVVLSDAGGQLALFTVDVTSTVDQALTAGVARIFFAISGSDEASRTVLPPAEFDCRTTYRVNKLVITHL